MNDRSSCDVAVIGAGPTGLTLANILGRAGLQVMLIERNASTVRAPRAVSIDDESLRTMQAIGLADEVLRDIAEDYGSHYYTQAGHMFARVEPTTREYGFPRRNAFTQPQLEATLLGGVRRFPNVMLLFEHLVESLDEGADRVTLRVRPLQEGSAELTFRATWVVACDGARSATRKDIGANMVGSSYPQRWLIVDLASTKERLRQTRVVCNPARPLITLPGPRGIRRYEFMLHDDEDDAAATNPDFVQRLLRENGPDAGRPIVRAQTYTFHALIADRWNSARIFLAGDAAHLSPPFAGQGLNSGLRDAFNLGWKLAAVLQGTFDARLLDTYFTEREPHARDLIQLAINMGKVMMPKSRLHAWLMQTAFALTRFAPGVQAYFTQMKYKPKPFYRKGFIAVAPAELGMVGRTLPQPQVETSDGRRVLLDEALGDGCRLIAYGRDAQQRLEDVGRLGISLSMSPPLAILPPVYNSDAASPIPSVRAVSDMLDHFVPGDTTALMFLRPDRYVALTSTGAASEFAAQLNALLIQYGALRERSAAHSVLAEAAQ